MSTVNLNEHSLQLLPDDCIFAVFEWLTLDDLCAVSRSCKRLQMLGHQHFRRKFPSAANVEVEIVIGSKGKLSISPNKNYVKSFQKFIRNIIIVSYKGAESADERIRRNQMSFVVNFMKRKCSRIHTISVEGDVDLVSLCQKVTKILRSAETVVFKDRNKLGVDEVTFLAHCPNMKTLTMEDRISVQNCNAIFQQKYEKLEHFHFIRRYGSDLRIDSLKTFFQHHPNIKTVAWIFSWYNHDYGDNALECLQTVDYVANLEHMFLLIDRLLADRFDSICNYLNILCNRHNFRCLEIEFEGNEGAAALKANSNFLANWKQCTRIHVTGMRLTEMISTLQSLTHLRTLVLTDLTFVHDWDSLLECG